MPQVDGRAAHTFASPHRAWLDADDAMLKRAVATSITMRDGTPVLTVTNTSGHAFPTGFPGRVAANRVVELAQWMRP